MKSSRNEIIHCHKIISVIYFLKTSILELSKKENSLVKVLETHEKLGLKEIDIRLGMLPRDIIFLLQKIACNGFMERQINKL